jgi:hypothetical protein
MKPTKAQELLTKYVCNPYKVSAIKLTSSGGRIRESQVSMAFRYTYSWHYNGSTHAAHNIKMN